MKSGVIGENSRWSALFALLRIEWRTRRREPTRTLWTLLALALPVAAVVAGGALLRTWIPTADERLAPRFGAAELRIVGLSRAQAGLLLLPYAEAFDAAWAWSGLVRVATGGVQVAARALALEPGAASVGLVRMPPHAPWPKPGSLRLAPGLSARLALQAGDVVALSGSLTGEFVATGPAQLPEDLEAPLLLLSPADVPAAARGVLLVARQNGLDSTLAAVRLEALSRAAQLAGHTVEARPEEPAPDRFEEALLLLLGGFALAQAALLIAAALTVGWARRRRELGLLGTNGAPPGLLWRAALIAIGLEALLAGVLGAALGLLLAILAAPHLDAWNGRWNGPLEVSPLHLIAAPLLATLVAALAVGWPARRVLGTSILEALGARRPARTGAGPGLWLGLGLLLLAALAYAFGRSLDGPEAAVPMLLGAVAGLVSLCVLAPALLTALARFSSVLPFTWRLALRDAGRFRHRDGAVVAVTLCAGALSVTLMLLTESVDRALGALPSELPHSSLRLVGPGAEELSLSLESELGGLARASQANWSHPQEETLGETRGLPPGFDETPWILDLGRPLDAATLERARRVARRFPGTRLEARLLEIPGKRLLSPSIVLWGLAAGLAIALVAGALALSETRRDQRTLNALGAAPALLRRMQAARSAYLAALGALLALPAGLLPILGLLPIANFQLALAWPRVPLLLLLLGLPLSAYLAAWCLWRPTAWRSR